MADPICRWRNPSFPTVRELIILLPKTDLSSDSARKIVNDNWAGDFFHTPYQLACQLGLYYELDGHYYSRFKNFPSVSEVNLYMRNWILKYSCPNPYTKKGFKELKSFSIHSKLCDILEENRANNDWSAISLEIFGEEIGNDDILRNSINDYSEYISIDKGVLKPKEGVSLEDIAKVPRFPGLRDRNDKQEFFNLFTDGYNSKRSTTANQNIVYFGPPGTGKTRRIYEDHLNNEDYKKRDFVTFHQAFSYEEFIEGLKPEIAVNKHVIYSGPHIREAAKEFFTHIIRNGNISKLDPVKTVSPSTINAIEFSAVRYPKYFGPHNIFGDFDKSQSLAELTSSDTMRFYPDDVSTEREKHRYISTQWSNTDQIDRTYPRLKLLIDELYPDKYNITLKSDDSYEVHEIDKDAKNIVYNYTKGVFFTACDKAAILAGYRDLEECINDGRESRKQKMSLAIESGNVFSFCIDEINRANVASVFGDLITLVESTKRLGADEELMATLVYSKKLFGVPANLNIYATMNTADRSVTLLDSALRRRFKFIWLPPNYDLLTSIKINHIQLSSLLRILNRRISYFLSKDQSIGHSEFLKIRDSDSQKKDLLSIIIQYIIPLLEEYFYGDYKKIRMVLGDDLKKSDDLSFYIAKLDIQYSSIFKGDDSESYSDDIQYVFNDIMFEYLHKEESQIPIEIFEAIQ